MLTKTKEYMQAHEMLTSEDRLIIGLSGGLDSVCLFHILRNLEIDFEAVHVNHGIRGEEAMRDENFVKRLCESHRIPLHIYHFDVPEMSRTKHLSEEEAGRMVRRQAFLETMNRCGGTKVALAHHGNDRAETFLFHLSRGSGIQGLSSMKPVEGTSIRPLLWAERKDLAAYMARQGYDYVEDSTNAEELYTRNKVRHRVIPLLEEVNGKAVAHICSAANKLEAVSAYLNREAEGVFQKAVTKKPGEVQVRKEVLYAADEVLYHFVFRKCVEYLRGAASNLTEEHFRMLNSLFARQVGKELHLPEGITAIRTYDGICLCLKEEASNTGQETGEGGVEISVPGDIVFMGKRFRFSLEPWVQGENFPTNHYTKCFDYDKIKDDIVLRTRETGDYLEINKDHGRKSLQDYLVNEKVPKEQRNQVVLLAEGSHVLWIIGKRISEYYKVTSDTKRILKVQMDGEEDEKV